MGVDQERVSLNVIVD